MAHERVNKICSDRSFSIKKCPDWVTYVKPQKRFIAINCLSVLVTVVCTKEEGHLSKT